MTTTYNHPQTGPVTAVLATAGMADWNAVTADGTVLGHVVDERGWFGENDQPSETAPDDESVTPYEAYDERKRFIAPYHSLTGALAAVVMRSLRRP